MSHIKRGRWTHQHDDDVVVFLIGMRVNRPWRVDLWWPAFAAMPAMLTELYRDPGSGLIGHRSTIGAGGPVLVQYWRSLDLLLAYANDADHAHRPAWRAFNQRARRSPGAVGIWHETFAVPAGRHESIYSDVPISGIAKATTAVAVSSRTDRARQRLRTTTGTS